MKCGKESISQILYKSLKNKNEKVEIFFLQDLLGVIDASKTFNYNFKDIRNRISDQRVLKQLLINHTQKKKDSLSIQSQSFFPEAIHISLLIKKEHWYTQVKKQSQLFKTKLKLSKGTINQVGCTISPQLIINYYIKMCI